MITCLIVLYHVLNNLPQIHRKQQCCRAIKNGTVKIKKTGSNSKREKFIIIKLTTKTWISSSMVARLNAVEYKSVGRDTKHLITVKNRGTSGQDMTCKIFFVVMANSRCIHK